MSEKRRYEKLNTDAYVEDHALIDEIAQKVGSRKEAIHVLSEVYRGKSPNIEGEKNIFPRLTLSHSATTSSMDAR